MSSRRTLIEMSRSEVLRFLEVTKTLIIATNGVGGFPHIVPMWFAPIDNGSVEFWTYGKSQKVINLRNDSRASILAEAGTTYSELRGVAISGRARLVEGFEEVLAIGQRVSGRYSSDSMPEEALRAQAHKRVGIVVEPLDIVSWDHRKLGGGY